ncbi:MAG: uracil-DNA glycosylase [Crenarchaeota archaeon]|nr:uracil-DNA glycosylase [Thermoproteota archaeon]
MCPGEWYKVIDKIKKCTKCKLHKTRRNPVPGEGPCNAKIMFVGEAPGGKEDETGRPFVGAAGQFLTELLGMAGLRREDVFITNILKCRPPNNRDPEPDEIEACKPYLVRQIRLISPKVIVTLGRYAGRTLLGDAGVKWTSMSRMHGKIFSVELYGVKLKIMPTYHPAAALYYPKLRPVIVRDFKEVLKALVEELANEGKRGESGRPRTILDFLEKS